LGRKFIGDGDSLRAIATVNVADGLKSFEMFTTTELAANMSKFSRDAGIEWRWAVGKWSMTNEFLVAKVDPASLEITKAWELQVRSKTPGGDAAADAALSGLATRKRSANKTAGGPTKKSKSSFAHPESDASGEHDLEVDFEPIAFPKPNELLPPGLEEVHPKLAGKPAEYVNPSDISDSEESEKEDDPMEPKAAAAAPLGRQAKASAKVSTNSTTHVLHPETLERRGSITEAHGAWGINLTVQRARHGCRKMVELHRVKSIETLSQWLLESTSKSKDEHLATWESCLYPRPPRTPGLKFHLLLHISTN
jgi:hypothetical protein